MQGKSQESGRAIYRANGHVLAMATSVSILLSDLDKWKKLLRSKCSKAKKISSHKKWVIQKGPLGQYIWDHKYHSDFIKCPEEVPIDIGCEDSNPRLSLLLYPFGLFEDKSFSMTLQIKLRIPDKCPPLRPTDIYL